MNEPTTLETKAQKAINKARAEVEEEDLKDAVVKLKALLRQEQEAETVLRNIKREIEDLEEAIKQGNA